MMEQSDRPHAAFTLVELLVVVGIVALLAALLFPVFGRVRASGRRATCASNLKQIGLAMSLYAQDNRFYPNEHTAESQSATYCSRWGNALFPYVKANEIFQCPSFPKGQYRSDCPTTNSDSEGNKITYRGSYDLNVPEASVSVEESGLSSISYGNLRYISPIRYTRPSSTILVADGDGYVVSPGYQSPTANDIATLASYGVDAHHEGGLNVAFADGHVKYMSMDALLKRSVWRLNGPED